VFFDPHVMLKIYVMKIFILKNIRTGRFVVVGSVFLVFCSSPHIPQFAFFTKTLVERITEG
jgi:hypothetical protein